MEGGRREGSRKGGRERGKVGGGERAEEGRQGGRKEGRKERSKEGRRKGRRERGRKGNTVLAECNISLVTGQWYLGWALRPGCSSGHPASPRGELIQGCETGRWISKKSQVVGRWEVREAHSGLRDRGQTDPESGGPCSPLPLQASPPPRPV